MSTDEWRERALAAEGELARLRAQQDAAPQFMETALGRARREAERRRMAPTEVNLPALRACAPNCPCGSCCDARPEPEADAWHEHQVLTLDPIHE